MKIYVVGSSKNKFLPLDNIREKFLINQPHEGDNIDFLNPWYCELTGLYWLCKNSNEDIVGLEHYRRYFVNNKSNLLSEKEINDILKDNDVICRKWDFIKRTNGRMHTAWTYLSENTKQYILKFLNTLKKNEKFFILNCLQNLTYFGQCNMFICKKKIIDDYCNWFFEHCTCFTKNDLNKYPRCIGFVSEFIFSAYLMYKKYKIYWNCVDEYDKLLTKKIAVF